MREIIEDEIIERLLNERLLNITTNQLILLKQAKKNWEMFYPQNIREQATVESTFENKQTSRH